ncbi:MAG: hypothetical protein HGA22_10335, partial [Clostridiales bacterium]|nr:hypothetical protein [Clostridiales bacterium]
EAVQKTGGKAKASLDETEYSIHEMTDGKNMDDRLFSTFTIKEIVSDTYDGGRKNA